VIGLVGRILISVLRLCSDDVLRALARALFSRSWKQFQFAVRNPRQVQTERLMLILERAQNTAFGREHGFSETKSLEQFQARVPVRKYEDFEPYISRMIAGEANVLLSDVPSFYARSSGTTGAPKYVPVTDIYLSEYRRPRRVWIRQVMQAFPGLLRGKVLTVHSPKIEGYTEGGTPYGSITVAMSKAKEASDVPVDVFGMEAVPRHVFLIEDFQTKYYAILRFAAQERISLAAAVNPSTLVLLAEKLNEFAKRLVEDLEAGTLDCRAEIDDALAAAILPKLKKAPTAARRIRAALNENRPILATDLWPELQGLLCWKGGSAPFYLEQLESLYPGKQMMDFGYLASEGGLSIVMGPEGAKGVAAVAGHFMEFMPIAEDGKVDFERGLLADELEKGCFYRVLITGSHGLYRYDINDVVECVGHYEKTAEIQFVHKGGNMLSITGEKVGESHVVRALAELSKKLEWSIVGFGVSVEFVNPPRYVLGVECAEMLNTETAQIVLQQFDKALCKANIEYASKRESLRLGAPRICALKPNAFELERARRVAAGAPDNHVKPRHLLKTVEDLEALGVEFTEEWRDD